jgi:hypothetical protein
LKIDTPATEDLKDAIQVFAIDDRTGRIPALDGDCTLPEVV